MAASATCETVIIMSAGSDLDKHHPYSLTHTYVRDGKSAKPPAWRATISLSTRLLFKWHIGVKGARYVEIAVV